MLRNKSRYSDFVISRAGENRELAAWIASLIEMQGLTITLQEEFFRHQDFLRLIGEALRGQTRVIALLSNDFLNNDACLKEAGEVIKDDPLNQRRRLVLFRIDNCKASGSLANIAFTDLAPILQQQDARKVAETVLKTLGPSKVRLDYLPPLPLGNHLVKTTILHPQIRENRQFTGRRELLARLKGEFAPKPGEPTVLSNTQLVAEGDSGLAGVGKSTLAREFAWRNRNDYHGVWWIPAHSRAGVVQSMIDLGERLSPPIRAIESLEGAAKMVIEALEKRKFVKPWLLVYDDVATPRVLENLLPNDGAEVLITTRWSDLYGFRNKVDVDLFSPELAVWYLCNMAGENDPEAASRIAQDLGRLPVSLSLAGSLCRAERISLQAYHDMFREEMRKRPRLRDVPWKHSDSLYVAFSLALDSVLRGNAEKNIRPAPLAGIIMGVCSFLAPDDIPLKLFQVPLTTFPGELSACATSCPHSSRHFDSHASRSIMPYEAKDGNANETVFAIDAADLSRVLMALVERGLVSQVELRGGEPGIAVHWLVQEMMRARLAEQGQVDAMAGLATGLLAEAFPSGPGEDNDPGNEASWTACARLVPHAVALFEHIPANSELASPRSQQQKAAMGGREVAILLNQVGLYLKARGEVEDAEPLLRRALEINRLTYGVDHENVAISLNNLASALQAKGWLFEAEPLYLEALKIDEHKFGRKHPSVARDLFNLGLLFQRMGRDNDVETLFHRALEINVRNFGRGHANIAIVLNSMARLYEEMGQSADAEPLYRRALSIDEQTYGARHPYVARDMESLAKLLKQLGRPGEAEPLFRKVLEMDEWALGFDHPDVAATLSNLAILIEERDGDYVQSEQLKRRALAIDEAGFGPMHPNVARDLNNLALLLKATGRLREAEPLMRRVIDIFEKSLGAEHQNVATTLNNLADLLRETQRFDEAETLYRRALRIDEHNFGLDHYTIARDYNNLALLLKLAGRTREAEPYARRALEILERNLRRGHPWVERARSNLAAIEADVESMQDPIVLQPVSEFDLAVLGEQANQTEATTLWDLFDEQAAARGRERSGLGLRLFDRLLRRRDTRTFDRNHGRRK